jgi:diguanylate cyclase (GGDEF)-like protein
MTQQQRLTALAQVYVGTVICAGLIAVVYSLYILHVAPVTYHWSLLAGLTLLSGSFTVRIPTIPARLSVSDTFVFAAVLLFGPAAATMIVVLDSLVISLWLGQRSRRLSRVLFNMAAPSVAIWIASHVFYLLAEIEPLARAPRPILPLLGPLIVLAAVYFLLNSLLIAWAVALEKRVSALSIWKDNFLWLSLNYFSGASIAALLLPYLQPEKPEIARVIGILLPVLLISYLTFKTAMGRVDDANRYLSQLNRLYLSTIETLAMAIDAKDQITHGHVRRVQVHAVHLAEAMGVTEEAQIRAIEAAALLHDMGKLAVPEYILNKPGPLTPAEFAKVKLHASAGGDILSAIDFPYPVVPIVRHHHENWDGTGYPDGLSGAAIPIGARILSVVDCFDALTSDRPYRPRLSDKDALKILVERRAQMYDPLVVDTFIKFYAAGGVHNSEATLDSPSAIAVPLLPRSQVLPGRQNRLDDITASGEEMLTLFELARGLSGHVSLPDVGDVIVKHLRRIVPSSLSVLYVYDTDTDELSASYASGDFAKLVAGIRIPLGQRLSGWVGANRQTIRNSDPVLDFGEAARSMTPRPRSCLSTPLIANDCLVGVLSLYSTNSDAFSEDHQRVVEVVATQVGAVIQVALTFERTQQADSSDDVNGLISLDQLQLLSKSQATDSATPMSLVYVEIEGLKEMNASYGRFVGGTVLNHIVACARRHLQPSDILCRHGRAELIIVQFQSDRVMAAGMASQIRQTVESRPISELSGARVKIKFGVSAAPSDGQSMETLIVAAQQRIAQTLRSKADSHGQPPESIH